MDESLTSFIEEVAGESHLRVEDDLGGGFVRLRRAEAERRQAQHDIRCTEDIVIEMLRNARDANARNIFLAVSREGSTRRICMVDDGCGIPEDMHEMVFEPRVTSKLETMHVDAWGVHGRGMALFSIASNVPVACIADSSPGKGTAVVVESDLNTLPEKTDQSSIPTISFDEDGKRIIRGPRNINRIVAEFSIEHQDVCTVFCGSVTDIVATLYTYGEATVSKGMRAFCDSIDDLPIAKRLCTTADPATLAELSGKIGLPVSERSARRILDGEIRPLTEVSVSVENKGHRKTGDVSRKQPDMKKMLAKDARGLKIHEADMEEFRQKISAAFDDLAEGYYLEPDAIPEIRVHADGIHIRIPLSKLS